MHVRSLGPATGPPRASQRVQARAGYTNTATSSKSRYSGIYIVKAGTSSV